MIDSRLRWRLGTAVALLAVAFIVVVPTTRAQEDPVTVEISGDLTPSGSAMVTAVINDGSTLTSVSWTQSYGVAAALSGADTLEVTAVLGAESAYKDMLFDVLAEPPIGEDQLPPNVELPEGEFPGGLQDRFELVGLNPFTLEETALVKLEGEVTTSSGVYAVEADIHTSLGWKPAAGIRNVPVGIPVLLHGKDQGSYDWALDAPNGSSATLMDASSQNPEFTPDVAGQYEVTVTDEAASASLTLEIYAGTWRGVIVGKDENDRPVADSSCLSCHQGSLDQFTPWAQTGHAEIFSDNLDTSTHYGESCFSCHTVGFDPDADNGGIDEASDYQSFLDANLINNPGDNWATVLDQFPETAQLANIQCENCHGPQGSDAHMGNGDDARKSISSDVCGTCHGEPLRHARFQQWQLSPHANYELAIEEGQSGSCARCHTGNGFLEWLPVLTGEESGDPTADITVSWTADETHPQTCVTCHDPHMAGSVSGDASNATVRISGDSPPLIAGFTATDVGRGAICMTCHNTRRGLRNDSTFATDDTASSARAPHGGAQSDVLMGQNAYLVEVGNRSFHSQLEDSCVTCHMESTPPPDDLAYESGGTNHTFYARNDICSECHSVVTADQVQGPVAAGLASLKMSIEGAILDLIGEQITAGNTVDLGGEATITDAAEVTDIDFGEYHGRQAATFTLSGAGMVGPVAMSSVMVVPAAGDPVGIYEVADPSLPKSGWNYHLINSDGSLGVHNPVFAEVVLSHSAYALEEADGGGGGTEPGSGGVGPVACTSNYFYWTEIAARAEGNANSLWRTDLVARNTANSMANLEFHLHTSSGDVMAVGQIDPMAQGVFEDVVGLIGVDDKGALEICSDQPLEIVSRVFNQSEDGTFGQFIDGVNGGGLTAGDSARLLGLRQQTDTFRTNISVTNTGADPAEVEITLYGTDGTDLGDYTLSVGVGMVVQDLEPFRTRAGQADLGWGFAMVKVLSGEGILTSASVVDSKTNDPTTIPMKR